MDLEEIEGKVKELYGWMGNEKKENERIEHENNRIRTLTKGILSFVIIVLMSSLISFIYSFIIGLIAVIEGFEYPLLITAISYFIIYLLCIGAILAFRYEQLF